METVFQRDIQKRRIMLEVFKEVMLILIIIVQVGMITQTSNKVTTKKLLKHLKLLKHNNKGNHLNLKRL